MGPAPFFPSGHQSCVVEECPYVGCVRLSVVVGPTAGGMLEAKRALTLLSARLCLVW